MRSDPGTYALILHSSRSGEIRVGRWGDLRVEPGYYVYVGSAFGPGGVQARVTRHFRRTKKMHWHIDYLCAVAKPVRACCSYEPVRLEHEWARAFSQMSGVSSIKGFGCSDCGCMSHLFVMPAEPEFAGISQILGGTVESWWPAKDGTSA